NVQLKSGTNHFHGELYEFHIDNFLAARPYFLTPGDSLPPNVDNDFGGTLGGPILKNKLFFFASYEGDIDHTSYVSTATVPTAAVLAGDFTGTNTTIYDPNTGNPDGTGKVSFLAETGRNAIPAARMNSNIAPLLALISQVKPTNNTSANNLVGIVGNPQKLQKIDTKVDWNATDKLRVTGRFNLHPYQILSQPSFGDALNVGDPANSSGHTYAVTIAATYVKSPHFVIDGSWGFTRTIQNIIPFFDSVKYGSDTMHISGVNLPDLPYGGGMPQFNINGYSGYGYQYPYLGYNDPILGYAGNATWTKGSHTIKYGFNINQAHMNHHEIFPDALNFGGNATTLNGGSQVNQYNGFAAFLLGAPDSWNNSFQPFGVSRLRSWQYNLYAKDTWQVRRQLTLSYGTGWTYMPVPTHGSYGLENYNLDTNQYEVCGFGGIPKDCGIDAGKGLVSPSLGFAYRPFGSWVVRGGFSVAAEQFNVGRDLMYNYPENIGYSASALNPYVAVGSLSNGVPTIAAPDYSNGVIPLPAGASFYALPQHLKHGYVESYNLTSQKQVGEWLVQVGFVGNLSIHQHQRYDMNYGTVGGGVASERFYQLLGTSVQETAIEPYGHSRYDSLQATLERRFANEFWLKSTYTYSKWIALCCDTNGFGQLATPIPEYQRLNYVASSGDQKHIFNLSGIVESPFGKQKRFLKGGISGAILGGWQLNAVATMFSGSPFSIGADGSSLNAPGSSQRADQVKSHVAIYGRKDEYFDVTAFAPVSQVRFGTAPYNSLVGPGAKNLDASIFRTFNLLDNVSTQFRIEAFNVTNTPHFADPGSDVSSVQYDANGNVTNLNGFGQITSTSAVSRFTDERYFRLGLKVMF
ncbi:MAG TPA: TonB-dependent receptor, partial [Edaphobacter sp.]|uniref:TonB-dependent receptor n=1 Tax=Edaphobacter sp. TaxID=1934404 RepID=UPI002D1832ED